MARNIRWFVTFKSLNGTDCRINIYDNDWPEGVTMGLRGAAEPFTYEESYSSDLLEDVIRYRTGYIRVIEDVTYGRLNDIYPEQTFDRYVEFFYGNHLEFNGYIQVQDFSNTLEPTPRVIELPVISPLGLFSKRTFPQILPPTTKTLGELLDIILAGSRYEKVTVPYTGSVGLWQTIYSLVVSPWNNDYHHSMTYGAVHLVMRPESNEYLIEGICKAFGWICHDTPTALVFTSFDHEGLYCYYEVGHIGDVNYRHYENITQTEEPLTDYYSLADDSARQDTLLPETGIEVSYEGDLGKSNFTFQRTMYNGVATDPNSVSEPNEVESLCNLMAVPQLFEISTGISTVTFNQDGTIPMGAYCIAWNGRVGLLNSLSGVQSEGDILFITRHYTKTLPGQSWGCTFDLMVSKFGSIEGLEADSEIGTLYVTTEKVDHTDYVEIKFKYHYDDSQGSIVPRLPAYALLFIHNIKFGFSMNSEPFAEYKYAPATDSDFIPNVNAKMSASVTMPISLYRITDHMIGNSLFTTKLTEYPYLFRKRLEFEGKFRAAASASPDLYHARMFSYMNKKWRLVALDFNPWDDEYTLKMQYSEIFDLVKYTITALAEHTNLNGYTAIVEQGDSFNRVLTIDEGYHIENIQIKMGGTDITSTAYDSQTGEIYIASISGNVVITVEVALPYDAEVEWLESSGSAYIDSGIECTGDLKVHFNACILTAVNSGACGGIHTTSPYFRHHWSPYTSGNFYWIQKSASTSAAITFSNSANTYYEVVVDPINGTGSVNGTNKTFTALQASYTTGQNYFIFARKASDGVVQSRPSRFKFFKMWRNGVLLRDFIPVRKDGDGYLYDRVSGTLFGNVGSGHFNFGDDVNP